jgi:hypothetical protein
MQKVFAAVALAVLLLGCDDKPAPPPKAYHLEFQQHGALMVLVPGPGATPTWPPKGAIDEIKRDSCRSRFLGTLPEQRAAFELFTGCEPYLRDMPEFRAAFEPLCRKSIAGNLATHTPIEGGPAVCLRFATPAEMAESQPYRRFACEHWPVLNFCGGTK